METVWWGAVAVEGVILSRLLQIGINGNCEALKWWSSSRAFPDYFKSELMETNFLSIKINNLSILSRLLQIGINGNLTDLEEGRAKTKAFPITSNRN